MEKLTAEQARMLEYDFEKGHDIESCTLDSLEVTHPILAYQIRKAQRNVELMNELFKTFDAEEFEHDT